MKTVIKTTLSADDTRCHVTVQLRDRPGKLGGGGVGVEGSSIIFVIANQLEYCT